MADAAAEQTPLPQRNGNQGQVKMEPNQDGNQMGGNQMNKNNNNNRRGGGMFRGGRGGGQNRNFGNRNQNNQNQNRPNFNKPNQGGFMKKNEGNDGGQQGGNDDNRKPQFKKNEDFQIMQRLKQLNEKSLYDLPILDNEEIKFSNRNRLYVGNLTNDVTEDEIKEMFAPFGEIAETFINKEKNFAFVKVDYHANAEKAKRQLDGTNRKGRQLRVRFAPNATTIRVRNLSTMVSNELLYVAFEIFGPIEKAVHICDDRGKPSGEGIVEFARKSSATAAVRHCNEKCFFLTSAMRPCVVDLHEQVDDLDGLSEKLFANKKNQEFTDSRSQNPRFAVDGSFEHEYATRWKQLYELYREKKQQILEELRMEEKKLEAQLEHARYEHETELLREQLRMREQGRDRHMMEWEMREKAVEEQISKIDEEVRRVTDNLEGKMQRQDEELRRRQQQNTLFMQAQQLSSILDQQERKNFNRRDNFDMGNQGGEFGNNGGNGNNGPMGVAGPSNSFKQQGAMGGGGGNQHHPGGHGPMRGGMQRPWDRREDNFQNKRRRF